MTRVRLAGTGWAAAILGFLLCGAGAWWRYPSVLGLGAALLLLTGLSLVSVLGAALATVSRRVYPTEVVRFGRCEGTVQVRVSRSWLPVTLELTEHIDGQPLHIGTRATYAIPTNRRGVFDIGPLLVVRRGVAGLAGQRAKVGGTEQVRVLPRVLAVNAFPAGFRRGPAGAAERMERGGTDLIGLREYVPGDDVRRLHWRTTARAGTLMIREDADPAEPRLMVLLDDRAGSYAGDELEEAVEIAASLAIGATMAGVGLHLATVSHQLDIDGPQVRDITYHLAAVTAQQVTSPPGGLPAADRDVVAVITGALADPEPLLAEAARSAFGVMTIVDGSATQIAAGGQVTVLRAGTSTGILQLWDRVVAG